MNSRSTQRSINCWSFLVDQLLKYLPKNIIENSVEDGLHVHFSYIHTLLMILKLLLSKFFGHLMICLNLFVILASMNLTG